MPYLLNLIYLLIILFASPWLIYKAITTGKYRQGMLRKFLGLTPVRTGDGQCVWFHAVSVGEVLLLRQVIAKFRLRHPDWEVVLSTTTNTGFDVARTTFPDLTVSYFPLDFTWAVRRAMRRMRPSLIVLAELELWPNFVRAATPQAVVAVINGRMSPRSFRGYRRIRWFMAALLRKVDVLAVQNEDYAERMRSLGAPADRVFVTGSVKYDGVNTDKNNAKTRALAELLRVEADDLVWIAGSTQEPEEQDAIDIYRRAKATFSNLRLMIVPRHKERFEEVAGVLEKCGLPYVRRSQLQQPLEDRNAIILLDTLGELGALWGLADVAFVGGSLHPRGGQNMIEPAAYGAAVTFGPNTWNFKETVERLLEHNAAIQVADAEALERETVRLLGDANSRRILGEAAQRFVQSQQGATERTLDLLDRLLRRKAARAAA